jgi:replicative DNA helicase
MNARASRAGADPTAVAAYDAQQLVDLLAGRLPQAKKQADGSYMALCPFHDDHTPSLKIGIGTGERGAFHCFGCETSGNLLQLSEKIGLAVRWMPDEMKREQTRKPAQRKIAATYDYVDENGEVLYQVVRFEPKDFRQRRPDGKGGWIWNLAGVRLVLYRLPELREAASAGSRVYIVEGEKDADRLWADGLVATTNAQGAGKWRAEYAASLAGVEAIIIPDNDDIGRAHARAVARSLRGTAQSVTILELPGLPPKGDVSDWFDAGHTASELDILILQTPEWDEPAGESAEAAPPFEAPGAEAPPEPDRESDVADEEPPHDLAVERTVLAAAMRDAAAMTAAAEIIDDRAFYSVRHRRIWQAIGALFEKGQPADCVLIAEELDRKGVLGECGGQSYLSGIAASSADAANVAHYARILVEKATRRRAISLAERFSSDCRADVGDIYTALDAFEHDLFDLAGQRSRGEMRPISAAVDEAFAWYDEAAKSADGITGLRSGWMHLDRMTAGFQRGEFTVVAARPGMGKTAFLLNIARTAAVTDGVPVGIFSLEMKEPAIAARLMVADARVDSQYWRTGRLNADEIAAIGTARDRIRAAPIYITGQSGLTTMEIRAKTRRLIREHGIRAIFVDYLQLVRLARPIENRALEVGQIASDLKAIAMDLNIPVIVASQVTRDIEKRGNNRPVLSDLRESGGIEQEADLVIFLHRPQYYGQASDADGRDLTGVAEIIIGKQRNGPQGTARLWWREFCGRFDAMADEEARDFDDNDAPY